MAAHQRHVIRAEPLGQVASLRHVGDEDVGTLAEALGVALCVAETEGELVGLETEDPNEDATISRISASKPLPDPIATCLK